MPREDDADSNDDELILNYENHDNGRVSPNGSSSSIIVPVDLGRLFVHLQTENDNVARIWLQRHTDGVRVDATGDGRQLVCFDIQHERRVVLPTSTNDAWLIARTETYILLDGSGAPLLMIEPCRAQRIRWP